jgi:hypothetical protein
MRMNHTDKIIEQALQIKELETARDKYKQQCLDYIDWCGERDKRIADLEAQLAEAQQVCWEAHQHLGGSLVQEMPEKDTVDIMDKLCNVINKANEVE